MRLRMEADPRSTTRFLPFALAMSLAIATAATAANPYPVMVGDPAPRLSVGKWIKGDPVESVAPGNVYVVEFWATWCAPCRETIPHLTELQKKFAGKATFVGVSVWEADQADVAPFVQEMGDKMVYRVASDSFDGPLPAEADGRWAHDHGVMSRSWMTASGWDQIGIPTAFVVDRQGKVAWIGDPRDLEAPLAKIVDGTWDLVQQAKEYLVEQEKLKIDRELVGAMEETRDKGDPLRAVELAEQFLARDPRKNVHIMGFEFECLYVDLKDAAKANACARRALDLPQDGETTPLPQIAYVMAFQAPEGVRPDAQLGLAVAQKANDLAEGKRVGVRQALARFLYLSGDCKQAAAEQAKAIEVSRARDKTAMQKRLDEYKHAAEAGGC
ncbi:MAG: TlpA disulfide reductase family protein [Acidobacteriota bacterium]